MAATLLCLLLLLVLSPGSLQAATPEAAYQEAREQLLELIKDEKRKRFRDQWNRVIADLDKAAAALPPGDLQCAAWFNGARAHAEMATVSYLPSDRAEAERRYRQVADRCPSSYLADDALYRVGEIFLTRDPPRARSALEELIRRFPKGDMVPLAREALADLSTRETPEESESVPGSHLPSAAELLAAMDAYDDQGSQERLAALEKVIDGEVPLSLVAGLKVKRVVLDPGHGGKDSGAIGPGGIKEKDLTLAMAKKLKRYLEEMGLEVFLTREKDQTLSLEDRTRFANEKSADLFLSLHVNASHNKKAFGIETYTLNLNSDRYAMRLAARENASSNRRIGDLQFILADLATKANTDDSVQLAKHVQSKMVSRLRDKHGQEKIRDLGVKQALFFVLVGAKMPAVLLETGFISHPEEVKRLKSETYQGEVMRGVADGVRQFILDRESLARGGKGGATAVF